jgi:microsomal dipeptidase-like Zn-dependent dipeptidase
MPIGDFPRARQAKRGDPMISTDEARAFNQVNTVVDLHAHPVLKTYLFDYNLYDMHINYFPFVEFNPFYLQTDIPKLLQGGVDVVLSTVYLPEKPFIDHCALMGGVFKILKNFFTTLTDKAEDDSSSNAPFDQTLGIIEHFENKVNEARSKGRGVSVPKSWDELQIAIDRGDIAFLHAVEGAHSLGRAHQDPSRYVTNLKLLLDRGVCQMTLAHFYPNDVTYQVTGLPPTIRKFLNCRNTSNLDKGLTPIGKDVVKEMLKIGMVVDLAHSTPKARQEVFEINHSLGDCQRPIVVSHAGVQALFKDQSNPDKFYSLDDDEIRKIRDCKGGIGLIADNYWVFGEEEKLLECNSGIPKLIETVDYIHHVTGTYENIAIGTDYDGFTDTCDDLEDPSEMPNLTRSLLNHISPDEVKSILGGNALRVLKEGWR